MSNNSTTGRDLLACHIANADPDRTLMRRVNRAGDIAGGAMCAIITAFIGVGVLLAIAKLIVGI